jgi:hypothetical protein
VSLRSLRRLTAAATLVLAMLCGWYYLMGTPQYSFSRFARAIHDRDAVAAERFVDVDRVAGAASDLIVSDYFGRNPKAVEALEALGQGTARGAGQAVKPLVAARLRREIRRMAEAGGQDPAILALPVGVFAVFSKVTVAREGPDAWLTYSQARGGQTRLRMSQRSDRSWQITEIGRDWVRRHLKDG